MQLQCSKRPYLYTVFQHWLPSNKLCVCLLPPKFHLNLTEFSSWPQIDPAVLKRLLFMLKMLVFSFTAFHGMGLLSEGLPLPHFTCPPHQIQLGRYVIGSIPYTQWPQTGGFSAVAPALWNILPSKVKLATSLLSL